MQKTKQFAKSFHLSVTGNGFCLIALLLVLAATVTRAEEPNLILATARNYSTPEKTPAPASIVSDFSRKNSQPATTLLKTETWAEFSSIARLEKQTTTHRALFQLLRENLHSNKTVSVQAGYGQIWGEESVLRKICSDRQEPSCAYIRASFSF